MAPSGLETPDELESWTLHPYVVCVHSTLGVEDQTTCPRVLLPRLPPMQQNVHLCIQAVPKECGHTVMYKIDFCHKASERLRYQHVLRPDHGEIKLTWCGSTAHMKWQVKHGRQPFMPFITPIHSIAASRTRETMWTGAGGGEGGRGEGRGHSTPHTAFAGAAAQLQAPAHHWLVQYP